MTGDEPSRRTFDSRGDVRRQPPLLDASGTARRGDELFCSSCGHAFVKRTNAPETSCPLCGSARDVAARRRSGSPAFGA